MGHGFIIKRRATDVGLSRVQHAQDMRVFQFGEHVNLLLEKVGIDIGVFEKAIGQHVTLDGLKRNRCFAQPVIYDISVAKRAATDRVHDLIAAQILPFQTFLLDLFDFDDAFLLDGGRERLKSDHARHR